MKDKFTKRFILERAAQIYQGAVLRPPEVELKFFLEMCEQYDVRVFVSFFVCYGNFGHSQPERLGGEDIRKFIYLADPFLQTSIKQRSRMP